MYTDEERAAALAVLVAHKGNYREAARATGIHETNLRRWSRGDVEIDDAIAAQKKAELEDLFKAEIIAAFGDLPLKRGDASYRDVATAIGIFFDKVRLLAEQSTSIVEERQGVTPEEAREGLRILKGGRRAG